MLNCITILKLLQTGPAASRDKKQMRINCNSSLTPVCPSCPTGAEMTKKGFTHFEATAHSSLTTVRTKSHHVLQHLLSSAASLQEASLHSRPSSAISLRFCSQISKTCSYCTSFLLYTKRAHYVYLVLFCCCHEC